jgi:histidyl-tRNA synthetase
VTTTPAIKAARGLRDILPEERAAWRVVERAAHRTARSFGYQEIEIPVIEPIELIERGVGADTDIATKEIYRVVAGDDPTPRLALRPEATASMVRAYFEGGLNQGPQPVRLYLIGPMFRHDRPQAGRYRQFYQFDIEAIGDESAAWDAEVIEMAAGWLAATGISRVSLELNSIGDANCRPAYLEKLKAYYRPLEERLHGDCQRRLEQNPLRLLDCKEPQCAPFKAGAPKITDNLCEPCAAAFSEVRRLLDAAGIEYRLNPYLVRGLDYYTRTVFEFHHTALGGAQNSLGGGGRYDGLAAAIGYPETPAVGFAGGIDRTVMMLGKEGEEVVPEPPAELLVLPYGAGVEMAVAAAQVARVARTAVSAAADYSSRSLRAKMRAAGKAGYRWVALMDEGEASRRAVQLRDMVSGEQREVAWEALPELLETGMAAP